jgi:hypothetical protein
VSAGAEAAILAAHARGDGAALVAGYADAARGRGPDEAAFLLTQAWIFALEAGDARAEALGARLRAMGRA